MKELEKRIKCLETIAIQKDMKVDTSQLEEDVKKLKAHIGL